MELHPAEFLGEGEGGVEVFEIGRSLEEHLFQVMACWKMSMPVGEIFGLGQRKSDKSALRYADEDIIDPVRLMWQVIDGSGSEGEDKGTDKEKNNLSSKRKLKGAFWQRRQRRQE